MRAQTDLMGETTDRRRAAARHLFAGIIAVAFLTAAPTAYVSAWAAIDFLFDGRPLDAWGLVRFGLLAALAATIYTGAVVFPAVWAWSRVIEAKRLPRWLGPAIAFALSGAVDIALFSRGYWLPDETLPNWPLWTAGLAFGPAFYVYWKNQRVGGEVLESVSARVTGGSD